MELCTVTPRPVLWYLFTSFTQKNYVAAFARDLESSEQVWSSESGYPGDVLLS